MNTAQIDESLENLMQELQGFKRASNLLTDAGVKTAEVIASAETIVQLSAQIHHDNQLQVDALQKYAAKSEQDLTTLVASVTDAQNHQRERLAALEELFQQEMGTLVASVNTVQERQEEALAELERSLLATARKQAGSQRQQFWMLFIFVMITLIFAGASLWLQLTSRGLV